MATRLRVNNVKGTVSAVLVGDTSVTLNAALPAAAVPVAGTSILPITLEPDTANEEIVWITGPASAGTTYPCSRAQEGSTAVAHAASSPYVHGPTALDVSSALRYQGAWSSTASYATNDEVTRAYSLFVAVTGGAGNDPLNDLVPFTPTVKQQIANSNNAVTTTTTTFAGATTAGNFLVATVLSSGTAGVTFTMPAGWISAGALVVGVSNQLAQMFYYPNAPATTSVAVTASASTVLAMQLVEFAGCPGAAPTVLYASSTTVAGTPTSSATATASSTATSAKTLDVTMYVENNNTAIATESGYTQINRAVGGQNFDTAYSTTALGSTPTATVTTAASQYNTLILGAFSFPATTYWNKIANTGNQQNVGQVGASGAAVTIADPESQSFTRIVLTANCTITLPAVAAGKIFRLTLVQDATGSRTVTYAGGTVFWPGGTAPTLTTTANKADVLEFFADGSGNWLGRVIGQNY